MCPADDPNVIPSIGVAVLVHPFVDWSIGQPGTLLSYFSPDTGLDDNEPPTYTVNDFGRTNYVGVSGYLGCATQYLSEFQDYEGLLCNRSNVTLVNVSAADGTSNTMMFGETLNGAATGTRDIVSSWMGVGGFAHGVWFSGQRCRDVGRV